MSHVSIQARYWRLLLALVALWGSAYMMIEVALRAWRPAEITGIRVTMAAMVLLIVMWVRGERWPADRRQDRSQVVEVLGTTDG